MLKKIRVVLALVLFAGITLLLLDFTGALHGFLGWMGKIQLLPAVLALNVGVIVGLALLTLVFGRVYCSVICPLGVLQDGISRLGTRGKKQPYRYRKERKWLRYGVWGAWVLCLVFGVQAAVALLAPYSAYGRMVQNLLQPLYLWGNNLLAALAERANSYAFYSREVWVKSAASLGIAIATLAVLVAFAWKHGRAYCNDLCPVGTTLSVLSRFSLFRPVIDLQKCRHCKVCEHQCKAQCIQIEKDIARIDYSRCVDCFNCIDSCPHDALHYRFAWGRKKEATDEGRRAAIGAAAVVLGGLAAKRLSGKGLPFGEKKAPRKVPLTPPGSLSVEDFYRRCTACQLCVAECPNQVLRPSSALERLMQPEMVYDKGFCRPECTRCSELCPSGAIRRISREEKTQYHMGTATVNPEACLEVTGKSACGKCEQACPSGAIRMVRTDQGRQPAVAEQVCTGCGACEYLCPVKAITVQGKNEHLA